MTAAELAMLLCDDLVFRRRVIADARDVVDELRIDATMARAAVRLLDDCEWRAQHAAAFALLAR